MEFIPKDPPRVFEVGYDVKGYISDCGAVKLNPDEQVTFVTEQGAEYDVTRKSWGFYATPSLNYRLAGFGLRGVLVKNRFNRYFVMLVEQGKEDLFFEYLAREPLQLVTWLDSEAALSALEAGVVDKSSSVERAP